jgi:hypothetical protein
MILGGQLLARIVEMFHGIEKCGFATLVRFWGLTPGRTFFLRNMLSHNKI